MLKIKLGLGVTTALILTACSDAYTVDKDAKTPTEIQEIFKEAHKNNTKELAQISKNKNDEYVRLLAALYLENYLNYKRYYILNQNGRIKIDADENLFKGFSRYYGYFIQQELGKPINCPFTKSDLGILKDAQASGSEDPNAIVKLQGYVYTCVLNSLTDRPLTPQEMEVFYYPFVNSSKYTTLKSNQEYFDGVWSKAHMDKEITTKEWVDLMVRGEDYYYNQPHSQGRDNNADSEKSGEADDNIKN